jgi:hypothetical protein
VGAAVFASSGQPPTGAASFISAYSRRPAILSAVQRLAEPRHLALAPGLHALRLARSLDEALVIRDVIGRQVLLEPAIREADAFDPEEELLEWKRSWERAGARAALHLYPGGHLFTDPDLPDHHPGAARLAWTPTMDWLKNA